MNPGDKKQRLTFKIPTEQTGPYPTPGYEVYTKAWGSLRTLKGSTRFQAAQSQMEHNREFTIPHQKKLLAEVRPTNMKVFWRKVEHDIESIEDVDGLRVEMLVILKAVT